MTGNQDVQEAAPEDVAALLRELITRRATWALIVPVVGLPIWSGRGATAALAATLAVLVVLEYARLTRLTRIETVLLRGSGVRAKPFRSP
jgi:phosphatidate cytidylyltransferase